MIVTRRPEPTADRDRGVTTLFDRYYDPMCRLAFVILGDAAVAEEIVMEALLRTFRGWTRIRNPEHADAYLRRAVVNLCRSRIRRKAIEARVGVLAPRSAPLWDAEARDTQRVVWEAVRGLPPRQRACVVLRYYEDLPEREIAEILECSVGTVKSQLAKARSRLERVLEETLSGGER